MDLTLDASTTALVLIDLQKGIVGRPLAPYSFQQLLPNAISLMRVCHETAAVIVKVNVAFAATGADRLQQPIDAPPPMPPGGLPADFAELVPEIASLPGDVLITKHHWGAFHGTELDLQLRRRGIKTIILGGVATNFGVESTAREGWQDNYAIIIAEDACSSMDADMHQFSVEKIMPRIARVRSTAQIIEALKAGSRK